MKNNGITLIALVITIIVLIILAGVSVAILTGENGIITKAREAKEATEIADIKERVQTDILGVQAENKSGNITKEQLAEILEKYFNEVPTGKELPEDLTTLILKTKAEYGGYAVKISNLWNGAFADESDKNLAKNLLKIDATAADVASKSPYVMYNNLLCRVLYNDDTHGLQIITAESVENVTIGSGDSEVEESDFVYDGMGDVSNDFKKAAASYNNIVNNLNKRAKTYMDTKGTATDARCLGSIPTLNSNSKFKGDTTSEMWSETYSYLETYSWNNKFKNIDTNYLEDVKQLNDLQLYVSSGYVWLATRNILDFSDNARMTVRMVDSGHLSEEQLIFIYSVGASGGNAPSSGFRPVFLLASDIVISSGNGSSENPYVIE